MKNKNSDFFESDHILGLKLSFSVSLACFAKMPPASSCHRLCCVYTYLHLLSSHANVFEENQFGDVSFLRDENQIDLRDSKGESQCLV